MLSIGEFSKICKVSAKTLRYYAEIRLIMPQEVNPENGYRYYAIEQLETMLFINRLKAYNFSLEEIKTVLEAGELQEEKLYSALMTKEREMKNQLQRYERNLEQLNQDLTNLRQGKSIMAYLDDIEVQLSEIPNMYLLSMRRMVRECEFPDMYAYCFGRLFQKVQDEHLTTAAPPMVLFHNDEFTPFGLDTEFAVPVKEYVTGTRDFKPGLCLKTVVSGSYSLLSSVYAKQMEWAEKEGYEHTNALFEVYVTDPSGTTNENEFVTEVYLPVRKK